MKDKYSFYPFREVEINKDNSPDKKRILSIARIRDVLVQKQLYESLYRSSELMFSKGVLDKVSFGYRKKKSAGLAIQAIYEQYQKGFTYALDADIKGFFDNLNHDYLMNLVDDWLDHESIERNLIRRFVHVDRVLYRKFESYKEMKAFLSKNKPERIKRDKGVPQGGILSGMLANLYLYKFDDWIVHNLGNEIKLRYYRYADDFVVLTRSKEDSQILYQAIFERLKLIHLEMHDLDSEKTKIIDIEKDSLEFLGFQVGPTGIGIRNKNIQKFKDQYLRQNSD